MNFNFKADEKLFSIENICLEDLSMIMSMFKKRINELDYSINELTLIYDEILDYKVKNQMLNQRMYFRNKKNVLEKYVLQIHNLIDDSI